MHRHRPQDLFATPRPRDPRPAWQSQSSVLPALLPLLAAALLASACSAHRQPVQPLTGRAFFESGMASWYGPSFHGRRTANGERYDMHELTAAHPTLPFGTRVAVTNLDSGRSVVVRINDRGPYKRQRVVDLSFAAANAIGLVGPGTGRVGLMLLPGGEVFAERAPLRYTVQVGAFSEAELAATLRDELLAVYPETSVDSDGTWNRVHVGLFADRDQAESLRRELAAIGMSSVVVAAR
jgi:rare lipoprotein A